MNPRVLFALVLVLLVPTVSGLACGPTDACSDLSSSLWGGIEGGLVSLEWTSDDVDSSISHFSVKRYPQGYPGSIVSLGTETAVTGCVNHQYDDADTPGVGCCPWVYRVAVVLTNHTSPCYYDVTPPGQ